VRGLLLAGGHGTRLRPLTFTGNKHMIPIANQPMLFYGLRHLADSGIREVGIVLGPLHEGIEEAVGDGAAFGLRVSYIRQGDPKGLAHAVRCARDFLGQEPFLMYLGDNLLQEGTRGIVERFAREPADAIVGVTPVAHPSQYGVVEMSGDEIASIEEKPASPRSNLALIGIYLFSPRIHPVIDSLTPSRRGELEITDAIWRLHQEGGRVLVRRVEGWWKDTGRPEDLLEANDLVLRNLDPGQFAVLGRVDPDCSVTGPVRVGRGTVVRSGAQIHGPVVLGDNVRVEDGGRVGPCTSVGDGVVIRAGSVSRAIVMESAEVSGPVDVVDSILGRSSVVRGQSGARIRVSCILGDSTQVRV
jgi:glucose-1-phosphate thymidylyltransferase